MNPHPQACAYKTRQVSQGGPGPQPPGHKGVKGLFVDENGLKCKVKMKEMRTDGGEGFPSLSQAVTCSWRGAANRPLMSKWFHP